MSSGSFSDFHDLNSRKFSYNRMPTYKDEHSFTPLLFEDDNAKNNYFSTKHIFGGLFNKEALAKRQMSENKIGEKLNNDLAKGLKEPFNGKIKIDSPKSNSTIKESETNESNRDDKFRDVIIEKGESISSDMESRATSRHSNHLQFIRQEISKQNEFHDIIHKDSINKVQNVNQIKQSRNLNTTRHSRQEYFKTEFTHWEKQKMAALQSPIQTCKTPGMSIKQFREIHSDIKSNVMSFEQRVLPPYSPLKSAGFPELASAQKPSSKLKFKIKGQFQPYLSKISAGVKPVSSFNSGLLSSVPHLYMNKVCKPSGFKYSKLPLKYQFSP